MAKKKVIALRDLDTVQIDYNNTCQLAGDRQYRIEILKEELSQLNRQILNLNREAAMIKKTNETKDQMAKAKHANPS